MTGTKPHWAISSDRNHNIILTYLLSLITFPDQQNHAYVIRYQSTHVLCIICIEDVYLKCFMTHNVYVAYVRYRYVYNSIPVVGSGVIAMLSHVTHFFHDNHLDVDWDKEKLSQEADRCEITLTFGLYFIENNCKMTCPFDLGLNIH